MNPIRAHDPAMTDGADSAEIELRNWVDEDIDFFHEIRNDTAMQRMLLAEPRTHTMGQVRDWLTSRSSQANHVFFVVARAMDDQPMGFVELRGTGSAHRWAMLGLGIHPKFRGLGHGSRALRLIEEHAVEKLRLHKIVLQVAAQSRAETLYRRFQYRLVGVHRDHYQSDGRWQDVAIMEKVLGQSSSEDG